MTTRSHAVHHTFSTFPGLGVSPAYEYSKQAHCHRAISDLALMCTSDIDDHRPFLRAFLLLPPAFTAASLPFTTPSSLSTGVDVPLTAEVSSESESVSSAWRGGSEDDDRWKTRRIRVFM